MQERNAVCLLLSNFDIRAHVSHALEGRCPNCVLSAKASPNRVLSAKVRLFYGIEFLRESNNQRLMEMCPSVVESNLTENVSSHVPVFHLLS